MATTATTGNLENAQNIIITAARFTEEHNAPAMALIEQMNLPKGAKQVTVPKVGQMTISDLQDGFDIVDDEEIGMTTVDLTASEVGAKVILTDKLIRQSANNIFSIVGRQLGDAMARKKDTDVHALYSGLNDGTLLGASTKTMSLQNLAAAIAVAKGQKFGTQIYVLHHPFATFDIANTAVTATGQAAGIPDGFATDLLNNFFSNIRPINGVPVFEDGNLAVDATGDAVGVIADKSALGVLKSVDTRTERQRDASMRATEIIITADYGVFEIDDTKGAGFKLNATAPATNN